MDPCLQTPSARKRRFEPGKTSIPLSTTAAAFPGPCSDAGPRPSKRYQLLPGATRRHHIMSSRRTVTMEAGRYPPVLTASAPCNSSATGATISSTFSRQAWLATRSERALFVARHGVPGRRLANRSPPERGIEGPCVARLIDARHENRVLPASRKALDRWLYTIELGLGLSISTLAWSKATASHDMSNAARATSS